MNYVPMTIRGAEKLKEELEYLKKICRPKIIQSIIDAREHGDLKENAEYQAAREQQSLCEGRIQKIEAQLSNAHIIDITKFAPNDRVIFGSTVCIKHLDSKKSQTYTIVGDDEADCKQNLISISSPIARGLVGKKKGELVIIKTPNGKEKYKIIAVKYS